MNRVRTVVEDERGVAVVLALIALITLTALVLAFLAVSAHEPQISRNLVDGTRARYLAEAGIEVAYDLLVNNPDWNALLARGTCAGDGVVLGTKDSSLPGLTKAAGTYTTLIRNDCQPGDVAFTGVPAEARDNGANDTNDRVILTSTGTFGNATRTITVVMYRVPNLLHPKPPPGGQINAAVAFPGVPSERFFGGGSLTVDGRDTKLDGTLGTHPSVYGISVGDAAKYPSHEARVKTVLASNEKASVTGKDRTNPSAITTGDRTVAADPGLSTQVVADFVNAVKRYADVDLYSRHPTPVSMTNIGDTCSTTSDSTDPNCWGNTDFPKIVYVHGGSDPTSTFDALKVSGTGSGAGILIIEDGDFTVSGNFRWEGPVIVTGKHVGVGVMGGGSQEILGALITNEMASDEAGSSAGVINGTAKIRYSRQALDNALALLKKKIPTGGETSYVRVVMYSWQEK